MDIFVQRMRQAMFLKGIRQADLAKATGFSDGQVSSWFNGKYRPNAEKISLIAKALGVSVDYLLGKDPYVRYRSEECQKKEQKQQTVCGAEKGPVYAGRRAPRSRGEIKRRGGEPPLDIGEHRLPYLQHVLYEPVDALSIQS